MRRYSPPAVAVPSPIKHVILGVLLAGFLPSTTGQALPPNAELVCPGEAPILPVSAYLRALALDLTGAPPTAAAYAKVQATGEVDETMLDDMLGSDAFANRTVRRHDALLWPNVTNVTLTAVKASLGVVGGRYFARTRATLFRGDSVECADEAARWDSAGALITTPYINPVTGKPSNREGWVVAEPYWLPSGQTLKVCAFDAQEALVSPSGTPCESRDGLNDPACGCGPELQWCRGSDADRQSADAMSEDLRRRIRMMIFEDRPYLDLFTSARAFVNGPLVHYLKHRAGEISNNIRFDPLAIDTSTLPDLHFRDKLIWKEITLPKHHAGILTSWAYLVRFQTSRARANRFYNSFLCQPFQPPATGIPIDPTAAAEPDLQKRAGCKYCHALLEPASSFWGRWTESGTGYLPADQFPAYSAACQACSTGSPCTKACRDFYLISAATPGDVPNLGRLQWYGYRRPEHEVNIEQGPRLLAYEGIVDGRLPTCVARTTAEWLLGRQLAEAERPWADQLATGFAADGYRYKSLVKSIVTSDVYRRVR